MIKLTGGKPRELRASERRTLRLRSVQIATVRGKLLGDGVMRDISQHGAKITSHKTLVLPDVFVLYDERAGTICNVNLRWCRGKLFGVKFVTAPMPVGSNPALKNIFVR